MAGDSPKNIPTNAENTNETAAAFTGKENFQPSTFTTAKLNNVPTKIPIVPPINESIADSTRN